jgi:hypothetical protein
MSADADGRVAFVCQAAAGDLRDVIEHVAVGGRRHAALSEQPLLDAHQSAAVAVGKRRQIIALQRGQQR